MALNVKNMRKWVKALRSGNYTQATGALKKSASYCCLGVACDISGVGKWSNFGSYDGDSSSILPKRVQEWLGIKSENPKLRFGHKRETASDINDELRADFNQIADAIERTWPQIKYKKSSKAA